MAQQSSTRREFLARTGQAAVAVVGLATLGPTVRAQPAGKPLVVPEVLHTLRRSKGEPSAPIRPNSSISTLVVVPLQVKDYRLDPEVCSGPGLAWASPWEGCHSGACREKECTSRPLAVWSAVANRHQAVWVAVEWEELKTNDIVRWRNPDRSLDPRISVVQAPAENIPALEGSWRVPVEPLTNGMIIVDMASADYWRVAYTTRRHPVWKTGDILLVPDGAPLCQGVVIALHNANGVTWEVSQPDGSTLPTGLTSAWPR